MTAQAIISAFTTRKPMQSTAMTGRQLSELLAALKQNKDK